MHGIRLKGRLNIGASFDVAYRDGLLYAIQSGAYPRLNPLHNGRLVVADVSDPERPQVCAALDGLGSARQIELHGSVAYVTSREDGLFAVDLSNPRRPVLISRYDTVEYATGVAIVNDLLVVSLRQYGLELVDASDPRRLRFLSLIRTGEAQSLCVDGCHVYAGVWGSKELVIANISSPEAPYIVSRVPLDGRGDGVAVRKGICYAATGQHARPPEGVEDPDPALYERLGNGLELFDVRDPAHPVRLSGIKFPPYYGLTFDMWDVQLAGDRAIVGNTRNGIYVVDVADPRRPALLSWARLPQLPDGSFEPIAGFDFHGDTLYLAGGETDTYLYQSDLAFEGGSAMESSVRAGAKPMAFQLDFRIGDPMPYRRALTDRNVRFVDAYGDLLYAACSDAGVAVLDRQSLQEIARLDTGGFAYTVQRKGAYVFVAACQAGLLVYRQEAGTYLPVARYDAHGRAVMDLLLSEDGRHLILQCASLGVEVLDVSCPETPRLVGSALSFVGLFYGRHFPSRVKGSRFFLGVNRDGCFAVEPDEGGLRVCQLPGLEHGSVGPGAGLEWTGEALMYLRRDEYVLVREGGSQGRPSIRKGRIEGIEHVAGKPRMRDNLLVVTERAEGQIVLADASDPEHIRCTHALHTSGSPDLACIQADKIYIPAGHQGLIVLGR